MPEIKLTNVVKRWKSFYGTDHVNLDIPDQAFVTLLGPSGCGKTTILRMIAGLETPTSGRIEIGDRVVFDSNLGINVPPNKRDVGFLFQNYALWPNMTVYQNIAFGLKNVKENLPVFAYSYLTRQEIIKILEQSIDKIVEIMKDSYSENRFKKSVLDEKKALIKLVDEFEISKMTAKEIFRLHLDTAEHQADVIQTKIEECKAKAEAIKAKYAKKQLTIDEEGKVHDASGNVQMKVRHLYAEEVEKRLHAAARIVKVEEFLDRYPNELSGGQQQRVAIARTLAPGPKVLFMDEPLSNLDAKLRLEMRSELKRLHMETGATFVYVTHDQLEAMTLATHICLLNNGVLQQYEAPLKVYHKPNNLFSADFVGNPTMSFVEASVKEKKDGTLDCEIFNGRHAIFKPNRPFSLKKEIAQRQQKDEERKAYLKTLSEEKGYVEKGNKDTLFNYHILTVDGIKERREEKDPADNDFVLGIRPEYFQIAEHGAGFSAIVYSAMPSGMETTIKLDVDGYLLTSVIFGDSDYKINETINISTIGNNILLFDKSNGEVVASGTLELK